METEAEEIPVDLPKENPILVSLCDDATEEEEGEEMELLGTASPTRCFFILGNECFTNLMRNLKICVNLGRVNFL